MGWLSDKMFGKRKRMDVNHINNLMAPTQGLVDEQLGLSRAMMDPNSQQNMMMRNLMAQRASESGAEVQQGMQKMAAQTGMSPGQAMMQQRIAQNKAMGGVNQHWMAGLQNQFSQGLSLMGNMTQMQQGLNENQANAYMGQINASNAARSQNMGMGMNLLGSVMGGMNFGGGKGFSFGSGGGA
jgi:hypothetical protein